VDRTGNWQVLDHLAEGSRQATNGVPPLLTFMEHLADSRLIPTDDLDNFFRDRPGLREAGTLTLADALVAGGLLTPYQLKCILAGQTFGLVLGNYRIVDRIGAGGMGVVYKAEHVHLKRPVAIKVLYLEDEGNSVFLQRFKSEMQALAVLRHPNIVLAFDASEVQVPGNERTVLRYLVMEYVQGKNLEQYVHDHGRLPIPLACEFIRQAASGLRHAHEHGLVHRDIKPSNLLVTEGHVGDNGTGQVVKILDFGLARLCWRRCTEAHAMLGTVDYMAPEQARDARSVDIRADIYGLGGTLYWLLTGAKPFPSDRPPLEELLARQHETPIPPRQLRPDIPLELETIVCQMMARDPSDRYPTPLALISALNNFLEPPGSFCGNGSGYRQVGSSTHFDVGTLAAGGFGEEGDKVNWPRSRRVLLCTPDGRDLRPLRALLEEHGFGVEETSREGEVLDMLKRRTADVVVIDGSTIAGHGLEICRRLRSEAPVPHLKLVLLTPDLAPAELDTADRDLICDDALPRSTRPLQILHRVRAAMRLREAEERADRLASHLLSTNGQLEHSLQQRDDSTLQFQEVLIFAMAKMAELRGQETSAHLLRMQKYVRALAAEARLLPAFANVIDDSFIRLLERCVLLHDIGKVAIPDHILLKPGKLDPEERSIMESHTILGANILEAVARQHGANLAFLQMAIDIVRHHHERFDGTGYPDGLASEAIPLSARIVTIADVYDAMRAKLVYKPGLTHQAVTRLMQNPSQGQFDPALLVAFRQCEGEFRQIFEQTAD
jgi:response regulator RpfG family c-di-GMP phosphodiesterase/serine/threonine protein kinase